MDCGGQGLLEIRYCMRLGVSKPRYMVHVANLAASVSGALSSFLSNGNMFEFLSFVVDYFAPLLCVLTQCSSPRSC